nr:membrane-spanning 4-domains subfamily A member 6A-like [Microcebus murinus]
MLPPACHREEFDPEYTVDVFIYHAPSPGLFLTPLHHIFITTTPPPAKFLFIVSGSLSVITDKRSTKTLVRGSLAGSILSTLCALVGFILLSVTLAALTPASLECQLDNDNRPTQAYHYYFFFHSYMDCFIGESSLFGTLSLMLVCTVLEFCLAVLTSVLWWKQANSDFQEVVHFLPQNYTDASSTHSRKGGRGYQELGNP